MFRLTITGESVLHLQQNLINAAQELAGAQEITGTKKFAAPPAITQAASLSNDLNATTNEPVAKPASAKPKKSKSKKGQDEESDNEGALENNSPDASPALTQTTAGSPFGLPSTPSPSNGSSQEAPRDALNRVLNEFLDASSGGMDKALAVLGKFGASKMSDIKDAQIFEVISLLTVAPVATKSIFS